MEAMCTCKAEGFFWLPSFQDGNCIRSCEAVASSCGVPDLHKRACRASLDKDAVNTLTQNLPGGALSLLLGLSLHPCAALNCDQAVLIENAEASLELQQRTTRWVACASSSDHPASETPAEA